jgi:hypothetical protein
MVNVLIADEQMMLFSTWMEPPLDTLKVDFHTEQVMPEGMGS